MKLTTPAFVQRLKMHGAIVPLFYVPPWHACWLALRVSLLKKTREGEIIVQKQQFLQGVNFN
jgi:hypothetical protein